MAETQTDKAGDTSNETKTAQGTVIDTTTHEARIAELERKVAELELNKVEATEAITTEQFLAWCDETLPDIINKAVAKLSEGDKPGKGVTKREVENMLHERRFEHMKTGPESAP